MRKIDAKKDKVTGMAAKTINFEKIVLEKLEEKANKSSSNVSRLVNNLCRNIVLNDVNYWKEVKRQKWLEFQEAQYNEEQAKIALEVTQC